MVLTVNASPQVLERKPKTAHGRARLRSRRYQGLSKVARERNGLAGHHWWQPSRAHKKFGPSRAAELKAALQEEADPELERKLAAAERRQRRQMAIELRQTVLAMRSARLLGPILSEIAAEKAQELRRPAVFAVEVARLERSPDIADHTTAVMLEEMDREVQEHLAAA